MSFSKTGEVFPKEGNLIPDDGASYACVVAAALRDELGQSHHAVKTAKSLRILTSMRSGDFSEQDKPDICDDGVGLPDYKGYLGTPQWGF